MDDIEKEKPGPLEAPKGATDLDAILAGNMPAPAKEKKPSNIISNQPAKPEPAPKGAMDSVDDAAAKLHELGEQGLKKGKELVDSGTKIINTKTLEGMDKWKEWSKRNPKSAAILTGLGIVALAIGAYHLARKIWRGIKRAGRWMWRNKWKILTLGAAGAGAYLLGRGGKRAAGNTPLNAPQPSTPAAPVTPVAPKSSPAPRGRLLPPHAPRVI